MKTLIDQRLVYKPILAEGVVLLHATFFELLGISNLLKNFPELDEKHKLFSLLLSILEHKNKNELLVHFYDQLFIGCLTGIKALAEINASFLLKRLEKKKDLCSFSQGLELYELLLLRHKEQVIHDLILHLAWDRTCVWIASLFERDIPGLEVLKECLVESFEHITAEGKSVPSVFRFIEALHSYYLKKENLPLHTEEEWQILAQGSIALQPRNKFVAVAYLDVVAGDRKVLTLDSLTEVKAAVSLTLMIFEKLKKEHPSWSYRLSPVQVFCVKETENGFEEESSIAY